MALAGLFEHRRHFHTLQAARRYVIEDAQVVTDVYRHTVIGHELRYPHADRGDLPARRREENIEVSGFGTSVSSLARN